MIRDLFDIDDHPVVCFGSLLLGLVLLIAGPWTCIGHCGGADGRHSVYVIAVEDQRTMTWDSTVVYVKTDPQASNEDKYCVTDPQVRRELDDAATDRRRVVIRYRSSLLMWRWECNGGDSIIIAVEQESP
jgi:hypothetical protein